MMRRIVILVLNMVLLVCLGAAGAETPSKVEKNMDKEIARLDRTASTPDGETAVVKRIEADFKVSESQVRALREQNLGYGEIVVVYSLAGAMPGGASGSGVERVLAIRQGPPVISWGQVAEQLKTKLGRAVSRVKKVNDATHRDMKKDQAAAGGAQQQAADPAQRTVPRRHFTGEGKDMSRGSAAQ